MKIDRIMMTIKGKDYKGLPGELNRKEMNNEIDVVMKDVFSQFQTQLDETKKNLFVEGLKLKGFEFQNDEELISFLKSNCSLHQNAHPNISTYKVNDIPFLEVLQKEVSFKPTFGKPDYSIKCPIELEFRFL
jgi:hypothetical protein